MTTDEQQPTPRDRSTRSRGSGALGRLRELMGRVPTSLWVVLGVAVVLRFVMWLAYHPTVEVFADTSTYLYMADETMFGDPVRPAGYSMFLRIAHAFSADLDLTIALQHVLGIVTGLLLYATVRRLGAPVWAGVIAAAAVLLSLDQILFEHTLMAEPLFTLFMTATLYAGVRALDDPRPLIGPLTTREAWIATMGVALGLSAWIRAAGVPMIPFLILWLMFAIPGTWRERVGRAALGTGAAVAMVLVYFTIQSSINGHFGFSRASGWVLYGRVAPFAECDQFDPPAGTEELCESTPPEDRLGPDSYIWGDAEDSPARRLFGEPPNENDLLGEFAQEAIKNQPLTYALVVFNDTARYLAPGFHSRYYAADYPYYEIRRRDPTVEPDVENSITAYYGEEPLSIDDAAVGVLSDVQQVLRVHPVLMLQALIVGALGVAFSRGRLRAGIVLLLGAGLLLLVIPSASATWSYRYGIPANGALIASGVIGLWLVIERLRGQQGAGGGPGPASG